jgi:hypothetical protein
MPARGVEFSTKDLRTALCVILSFEPAPSKDSRPDGRRSRRTGETKPRVAQRVLVELAIVAVKARLYGT